MQFANKNVPAMRNQMFIWEKNVPPKQDPGFMKVVSLLGRIYYHKNTFCFLNRILLLGERKQTERPHVNTEGL